MAYKIVYTPSAIKDIKKLDSVVKKRIKKKIELFLENPIHYSRRLTSEKIGEYRWRVGDYRIVFDISNKEVIVLKIRHRRDVYLR